MNKTFSDVITFSNCVTVSFSYFANSDFTLRTVLLKVSVSQRNITSDRNRHCVDIYSQYNNFLNMFIRKMSEQK